MASPGSKNQHRRPPSNVRDSSGGKKRSFPPPPFLLFPSAMSPLFRARATRSNLASAASAKLTLGSVLTGKEFTNQNLLETCTTKESCFLAERWNRTTNILDFEVPTLGETRPWYSSQLQEQGTKQKTPERTLLPLRPPQVAAVLLPLRAQERRGTMSTPVGA